MCHREVAPVCAVIAADGGCGERAANYSSGERSKGGGERRDGFDEQDRCRGAENPNRHRVRPDDRPTGPGETRLID